MEPHDFLSNFIEQFDVTDPNEISIETEFQELDEWSSLTALALIGMAKTKYGKTITGREIRNCRTVEDLYNLINSK